MELTKLDVFRKELEGLQAKLLAYYHDAKGIDDELEPVSDENTNKKRTQATFRIAISIDNLTAANAALSEYMRLKTLIPRK